MNKAMKMGAAAFCAVVTAGCGSTLGFGAATSDVSEIQTISMREAQGCRYITRVNGPASYPGDKDLYLAAMERVRSNAAQLSANSLVIRSYEIQSASAGTTAKLSADLYACNTKPAG